MSNLHLSTLFTFPLCLMWVDSVFFLIGWFSLFLCLILSIFFLVCLVSLHTSLQILSFGSLSLLAVEVVVMDSVQIVV